MMVRHKDGGPAFPVPIFFSLHGDGGETGEKWKGPMEAVNRSYGNGMSLRDKFADSALPSVLQAQIDFIGVGGKLPPDHRDRAAQEAYRMADAMLEERERETKK